MSINDEIAVLREVAPFAALDSKKLKLLAFMSELMQFEAGETILRQGDRGDAVFVLIDGLIEVSIASAGTTHRRELGRHTFFGEIAVMKGTVRAATVRAKTGISALMIPKDVLHEMIEDEPELGQRISEHIENAGYTFP